MGSNIKQLFRKVAMALPIIETPGAHIHTKDGKLIVLYIQCYRSLYVNVSILLLLYNFISSK